MDSQKKLSFYKECHLCQCNAPFLCFECNYYLCQSCYDLIHSKQKNSSHKKEPLDRFVPIELNCQIHQKIDLIYFVSEKKVIYLYNHI